MSYWKHVYTIEVNIKHVTYKDWFLPWKWIFFSSISIKWITRIFVIICDWLIHTSAEKKNREHVTKPSVLDAIWMVNYAWKKITERFYIYLKMEKTQMKS